VQVSLSNTSRSTSTPSKPEPVRGAVQLCDAVQALNPQIAPAVMMVATEGLTRQSPSHMPVQQILLRDSDAGVHVDTPLQVGAVDRHVMTVYHPRAAHQECRLCDSDHERRPHYYYNYYDCY